MKYNSRIFYYIFLSPVLTSKVLPISACKFSSNSASKIGPKFCINCKFYKKDFISFSEFGKCTNFLYYNDNDNYLVNGKINNNLDQYHYCSTARKFENMCGKEGKFYEEKK
jgi:hypothetical protein